MSPSRATASSSPLEESQAPLAVLLLGPTGSGKTALSLALGERFGGEIVSCDSVAVYRGMELGTAKPTNEERARLPHHMIDVADPDQPFTAGEYSRRARAALREIASRNRLPIVTGGTGLYLRALTEGLFAGPERQQELRARLERSRNKHEKQPDLLSQVISENEQTTSAFAPEGRRENSPGWSAAQPGEYPPIIEMSPGGTQRNPLLQRKSWLHRLLQRLDPASAERIHSNDAAKLMRAIEVCLALRKPLSQVLGDQEKARDPLTGFRLLRIGLNPPRQTLYNRLDQRAADMFAAGLIEETRGLLDRYGPVKALDSLGYRQGLAVLAGSLSFEAGVVAAQQGHRNYAKRQLTWFRREPEVHWIAAFGDEPEALRTAGELILNNL
ncbi:MAG: tRNA (adenosine(37)-N6)-dimethylallyltransferase [Terracidiphilus sp.]